MPDEKEEKQTRWLLRDTHGDEWETLAKYTEAEVRAELPSNTPVHPIAD